MMKTPLAYMSDERDIPKPNAVDQAAGVVGPMEAPIDAASPLLRLKMRRYRKEKARMAVYRHALKHEGRKPYVSMAMQRLKKLERLRSSHGLPVTSFLDKSKRLCDSIDKEFYVMQNQSSVCLCLSCQHLRRWSSTLQPYRCTNTKCRITFARFTDLYEHQLDIHGRLDPRSNRIVNELYHQQQGMLAFPPPTVYAGQQFMTPSCPPMPWKSMEELDEEATTLMERLRERNLGFFVRPYNVFKIAYDLVKRNGWKEMKRQYHIALEHYFAAMKYPASSRGFHDGCPSVERGRNWLTSTDREDGRLLHPVSLGDKVDAEPEFFLIDTKRDQEMYVELSDDEDDVDVLVDDRSSRQQKMLKTEEDADMEECEGFDCEKAAHEQKVYNTDSHDDDDANSKQCEVNDGETTAQNGRNADSDNANDTNSVKSEGVIDSDSDAQ